MCECASEHHLNGLPLDTAKCSRVIRHLIDIYLVTQSGLNSLTPGIKDHLVSEESLLRDLRNRLLICHLKIKPVLLSRAAPERRGNKQLWVRICYAAVRFSGKLLNAHSVPT